MKIFIAFLLTISLSSISWADIVDIFASGDSSKGSIVELFSTATNTWTIGSPIPNHVYPIPVTYDPNYGPWGKILAIPADLNGSTNLGGRYILDEYLTITGEVAWLDWHEAILDDYGHSLEWDLANTFLTWTIGGNDPTITPSVSPTSMNNELWFFFDSPLVAGTQIHIHKELILSENNSENNFTNYIPIVKLGEYPSPTIPEPSTFLLVGAGLVGVGFLRKKLKS